MTDIPGTTRDLVRERIVIAGIPFDVHDTAGFRRTSDPVERIGVERAARAIDEADLVLVVVDDRDTVRDVDPTLLERAAAAPAHILVRNKIDLSGGASGVTIGGREPRTACVSALTGAGLAELEGAIVECVAHGPAVREDAFMARRRHLSALTRAPRRPRSRADPADQPTVPGNSSPRNFARRRRRLVRSPGYSRPRNLLAHIFSTFCIGK